jgi:nucleotide-binding universal stress UspA family protein
VGKRFLVATDFSDASRAASVQAAELAVALQAEVTLIHVLSPGGARRSVAPGSHRPPPEKVMSADDAQGAALKQVRDELFASLPHVTLQLVSGESAAAAIVEQAASLHVDLIVLGTHGRTGLSHALVGSVAEVVVRRARCPVLVVPHAQSAR